MITEALVHSFSGLFTQLFLGPAQIWLHTQLNLLRSNILAHARGKATLARGVFTLDVPTGGGKTLASLGFALAHAKAPSMSRIVYGIPFTSINLTVRDGRIIIFYDDGTWPPAYELVDLYEHLNSVRKARFQQEVALHVAKAEKRHSSAFPISSPPTEFV
jgi:hypothetical protein